MLPWLLCAALFVAVLALSLRLYLLQASLDDIGRQLGERLETDTNNPIFLATRNVHARRLAADLNVQLRDLRRARRRFEEGDRAVKEAVTNISHDLRTPLTAICGYLELLEGETLPPEPRRCLTLIGGRVEAMRRMTEELFSCSVAVSDRARPVPETVDLNGAVEEAVAGFYAALTARRIVPEVNLPAARVTRRLDRGMLGRILENLLSNALKYSGGDLSVTLSEAGELVFSNSAPGLDGVGTAQLFDRFFTVETGRRSTGLGLSIAKGLAEELGGTLTARYEAGRLSLRLFFPQ